VRDVLVSGHDVSWAGSERFGEVEDELCGFLGAVVIIFAWFGEQSEVVPEGMSVAAPPGAVGPAGQDLTGVPFALSVVEQAARSERLMQAPQ
jgi:hypothetical protein